MSFYAVSIEDALREMQERRSSVMSGTVSWGPWRYDPEILVLLHENGYEVDLERMSNSATVLDWIAQVCGKIWCDAECAGHLVKAIDELLSLQSTCCGCGVDKEFNVGNIIGASS